VLNERKLDDCMDRMKDMNLKLSLPLDRDDGVPESKSELDVAAISEDSKTKNKNSNKERERLAYKLISKREKKNKEISNYIIVIYL